MHFVKVLAVFTLISAGIQNVFAQSPRFALNSDKGCAPFTVEVTDLSGSPEVITYNYHDYNYDPANDPPPCPGAECSCPDPPGPGCPCQDCETTSWTYYHPGTYMIIQTIQNTDPRTDTLYVEVVDPQEPEFVTANCSGTFGSVNIPDNYYESYYVEWGDGNSDIVPPGTWFQHNYGAVNTYNVNVQGLINGSQTELDSSNYRCGTQVQPLQVSPGMGGGMINVVEVLNIDDLAGEIKLEYTLDPYTTYVLSGQPDGGGPRVDYATLNRLSYPDSITVGGLNTFLSYYCFQLEAVDVCSGNRFPQDEGCSVNSAVASENDQNRIFWDTESNDFLNYELFKDDQSLVIVNSQQTGEYRDNDVNCGMRYCYRVELHERSGFVSRSATVCATAKSSSIAEPIINISASVDGDGVLVTWMPPLSFPPLDYIPERQMDDGSFVPLDTVLDARITDPGLQVTGRRYFYKVYVRDECGNRSDSSAVAGTILLQLGAEGLLTWSTYGGWNAGVNSYILEKYDQTGQLIIELPMGQDTTFRDNPDDSNLQGVVYRVRAVPVDSQVEPVYSNYVIITYRSEVHFPNAFTPNGDGLNDTFTFKGRFIRNGTIKIFTRWGELIYETSELDRGWDGTVNGQAATAGTYVYKAELTDDSGIAFVKTGQVVLIR